MLHGGVLRLGGDDLGQAVDEHVGDIVVPGVEAADEAPEHVEVGHVILAGFHQTDLVVDIIGQLGAPLDADHVAVLTLHGRINELDHLLGLAGALDPHDHSHHNNHSLLCPPEKVLRSMALWYHFSEKIATVLCRSLKI